MVRSIGADHVIDYTQEDFTKNGQHYDLILAASGYHSIFRLQACIESQGNLCHDRRFHGSNVPGYAPGTMDFNDREQENGYPDGESKPRRIWFL